MTGFRTLMIGSMVIALSLSGCKSHPPRSPRIIDSRRPNGPIQAPPLNSTTPIEVPTGAVATPVPAVPVQPSFAVPAQPVQPVVPGVAVQPGVPVQPVVPGAAPAQPAVPVQPVVPGTSVPPQQVPVVPVQPGATGAVVPGQSNGVAVTQAPPQKLQTPVPEVVNDLEKKAKKAANEFEPEKLPNLRELEEEESQK